MILHRKIYTNLDSGAEVFGDWYKTAKRAKLANMIGEFYMIERPQYSLRMDQKKVTFLQWLMNNR